MEKTYYDVKTPEMVERLKEFWADLAELEQLSVVEPSIGHYPADLEYPEMDMDMDLDPDMDMSSTATDGKHWHFAPDQHYFLAQGAELPYHPYPALLPPQESEKARVLRHIITWCLAWMLVGELILILWPGAL